MSGHALDPFLDAWAAQGGRDGPDLRFRAYRAAAVMPERDLLADTLRAVLAWDEADRARFDRLYGVFFRESLASAAPDGFDAGEALAAMKACAGDPAYQRAEPIETAARTDGEAPRPEASTVSVAAVAVGLLAVALAAGTAARSCDGGTAHADGGAEAGAVVAHDARVDVVRDAATEAASGACDAGLGEAPDAAVAAPAVVAAPPRVEATTRERGRRWGTTAGRGPWWLTWLLAMASSGAAASALARWRGERRAAEKARREAERAARDEAEQARRSVRVTVAETPDNSEPDYSARAPAAPFDAREEEQIAWSAGFARADAATELDARRTVAESARRVGVFSPVYRARAVTAGVTLVVPEEVDVVAAALIAAVERALRLQHVPVEVTRDARRAAGAELALVFVDARNPYTVPLHRWWRHPRVAAVEVRDPWNWGDEVETLAVDGAPVRVHAPTAEGIAEALLAASRGVRGDTARRVRWDDDAESVGDAFSLAAACALCEPCDLATVDALRRRFTPGLPFVAAQRIAGMEGVHATSGGWTFARALREHLRARVGAAYGAEVLAWQAARLEELRAQEGTRAAVVLGRERALAALRRARATGDKGGEGAARRALAAYEADEAARERVRERLKEFGEEGSEGAAAQAGETPRSAPAWRAYAAEVVCAAACAVGAAWSAAAGVTLERVERAEATTERVERMVAATVPVEREGSTCAEGMALIRGGTFLMGSLEGVGNGDEHPQHAVTVATFCIDRMEVSVAGYRACMEAGACTVPDAYETTRGSVANFCNWSRPDADDHPVNCLDWSQARTFCAWNGNPRGAGRLPREAEWEFAARGTMGRTYPWGETAADGMRVNLCGDECVAHARSMGHTGWPEIFGWRDGFGATAPVTAFDQGATPEGVLNLAGNVWEWVEDPYRSDGYALHTLDGHPCERGAGEVSSLTELRVLRGGSWSSDNTSVTRAANRGRKGLSYRGDFIGFRCARSPR